MYHCRYTANPAPSEKPITIILKPVSRIPENHPRLGSQFVNVAASQNTSLTNTAASLYVPASSISVLQPESPAYEELPVSVMLPVMYTNMRSSKSVILRYG